MRRKNKRQRAAHILVLLSLLSGVLIYALFRRGVGYINLNWASDGLLKAWIIYSLPDALWMFSLSLFILAIWDFRLGTGMLLWYTLAVLSGMLLEALQYPGLLPGTFDMLDLLSMAIAAALPLLITLIRYNNAETNANRFQTLNHRSS